MLVHCEGWAVVCVESVILVRSVVMRVGGLKEEGGSESFGGQGELFTTLGDWGEQTWHMTIHE